MLSLGRAAARAAGLQLLQRSCAATQPAAAAILPSQHQHQHQHMMSSSQQAPLPAPLHATAVRLHSKAKVLEVTLSDGSSHRFSAELLRVCSPSAENCSTAGGGKVVAGRRHVGIMRVELVGNYALRLAFDDLHDTGIYTWEFLHDLSMQRWSRARGYLRALRAAGLSRDPQRSRGGRGGSRGGSSTPPQQQRR